MCSKDPVASSSAGFFYGRVRPGMLACMATTFDKPSGLPVFEPHDAPGADCVLVRLLAAQPWRSAIDWPRGFEGGIAHRLDNHTSGAILAADSLEELAQLRQWFAQQRLVKAYRMLAARDVPWDRNRCEAALAHHPTRKNRMVAQRGRQTPHRGKWYAAATEFRRIEGRLFEVTMCGGVMHQIRAHAAFVGIPILGDHLYGGGRRGADERPAFFLHHVGMRGPNDFRTESVVVPEWAKTNRE